jgi:hypothetical protein
VSLFDVPPQRLEDRVAACEAREREQHAHLGPDARALGGRAPALVVVDSASVQAGVHALVREEGGGREPAPVAEHVGGIQRAEPRARVEPSS